MNNRFSITSAQSDKICARNAWIIEKVDDRRNSYYERNQEGQILHYGQPFRLVTIDNFYKKKLYLRSDKEGILYRTSQKNRGQEVSVDDRLDYETVWYVQLF